MKYLALQTYFRPKSHLVCRFCTAPIATLDVKTGLLAPTDTYCRAEATLESGQTYRINGCAECITSVTPEDAAKALKADKAVPSQLKALAVTAITLIPTDVSGAIINPSYSKGTD